MPPKDKQTKNPNTFQRSYASPACRSRNVSCPRGQRSRTAAERIPAVPCLIPGLQLPPIRFSWRPDSSLPFSPTPPCCKHKFQALRISQKYSHLSHVPYISSFRCVLLGRLPSQTSKSSPLLKYSYFLRLLLAFYTYVPHHCCPSYSTPHR